MPRIVFTPQLGRHVEAPEAAVAGATLHEALAAAFALRPALRDYVVDERFRLRRHVIVFIDGAALRDRETLSDPVRPDSEIYVMQALSGG